MNLLIIVLNYLNTKKNLNLIKNGFKFVKKLNLIGKSTDKLNKIFRQ